MVHFGPSPPSDSGNLARFGPSPPLDSANLAQFGQIPPPDSANLAKFGPIPPPDSANLIQFGQIPPQDSANLAQFVPIPPSDRPNVAQSHSDPLHYQVHFRPAAIQARARRDSADLAVQFHPRIVPALPNFTKEFVIKFVIQTLHQIHCTIKSTS